MNNKRLRVGIIFNFNPKWMGGIIYILNLVKTINYLDDKDKPEIFLFYRSDLSKFLGEINYPYLNLIAWNFPSVIKGYLLSLMERRNIFIGNITGKYDLDTLFPVGDFPVKYKGTTKIISWCPDLQNKYYPEFFSRKVILGRSLRMKFRLRNNNHLLVSSQSVLDDFYKFYKIRNDLHFHKFHFVSVIDGFDSIPLNDLRARYNLPDKYFIISNQFHKHKNHKVVLQAFAVLKKKGIIKNLAITGRMPDTTNSPYLQELSRIVEKNELQDQILFLGVIPRHDQLQLIKFSQAVIQPSLFEGWSTVIEDAKSLQVPVVASDLNVNIEQLGGTGTYFNPHDPDKLASILASFPERNHDDIFYEDYTTRIKKAAERLINIFS